MAGEIIAGLNRKELNEFKRDFTSLIRVYSGIAEEYLSPGKDIDKYLEKLNIAAGLFNIKYNNLSASLKKTADELRLRIFIKEKTVLDIFKNASSRIDGLKSIGSDSPGKANIEDADKFSREIEKIKDKAYISYYQQETGSSTIFIEEYKEGLIELHYSDDIMNEKSPEFKLCAYYAVKDGIGQENLNEVLDSIGFVRIPGLDKVRNFLNRFSPRIEE